MSEGTQVHDNWYDSMTEAIEVIESVKPRKNMESRNSERDEWAGGSFAEAMRMAREGWTVDRDTIDQEIEAAVEEVRDRLNAHIDSAFAESFDVAGSFVNIDRFLMGEPECMVEQWVDEAPKRGKVLKVLNMVTANVTIDEAVLRQRGRAVAVAVEVLHQLGFSLELWAGEAVAAYGNDYTDRHVSVEMVKVKEAHDPMDWDAVMFALGHPAMLRRFVFGLNETRPAYERNLFGFKSGGGYGSPCALPEDLANGFDVVLEQQRSNSFDRKAFIEQLLVTAETARIADVEV